MASSGVIGGVGCDRSNLFALRDLLKQVKQEQAAALPAQVETGGTNIARPLVHADIGFAPLHTARRAVLVHLPLAVVAKLDAGAIDMQCHGLARATVGDLHCKPRLTATERGGIRIRPVQSRHLDEAGNQAHRLPERKAEQHFPRQTGLDRALREGL